MGSPQPGLIVMADDDLDDQALTRRALGKSHSRNALTLVNNGEDLLDLLRKEGRFVNNPIERPALILLDLNMPLKNGFDALREIRADERLRDLPVVMLSTSRFEEDVAKSFKLGCNSFLMKPDSFEGMAKLMGELTRYWFEVSRIPGVGEG